MTTLRMKYGKTLRDGIDNETVREMTGVESINEFLREQRLRWFRHIEKMNDKRVPMKVKNFVVDGLKRGRPNKRWIGL